MILCGVSILLYCIVAKYCISHESSLSILLSHMETTDPNAMAMGPPANDITAPPISGGLGMIPTGLSRRTTTTSSTQSSSGGMMTMGGGSGGEGVSERFDAGGHETTFSLGGSSGESNGGSSGGGWWPFGGSSS